MPSRQIEHSIRAVFDDVLDGVQILDFDLRYLYLNKAAAAHGRRPADELLGRRMAEVYPGIEQTRMYAALLECLQQRAPIEMLNRFQYADGTEGWFDLRINPVPSGVLVLSHDVTVQRAREEEVRRSREDLAAALESMADALITTDVQQHITRMNRAAETLVGVPAEDAIGQPLDQLMSFVNQRTGQRVHHAVEKVLAHGKSIALANDTFLVRRNDQRVPIAASAAPLRDHAGALRGVVLVMKDMTEEYALREQLLRAQKLEAVGRLASGVAHDFNNVLTVISGCCALALDEAAADSPMRQDLLEIGKAAERGRGLARQLLAFSREMPARPELLDVNEAITGISTMLRKLIGEDIELRLELGTSLPQIYFDPTQLDQIIINLAVNARDAMPGGGRITITSAWERPDVVMRVSDTGIGMDAATRAHIFEPFFTTKSENGGTGLGLSTTYGIVTNAGGRIAVRSEPGQGATFEVRLPTVPDVKEERHGVV